LATNSIGRLGETLGQTPEQTAWSVLEVATANMYAQFTPLMARHGVDPRDFAIMAYGGAGPTHTFLLAREVGVRRVIVPSLPGGMCALGCLVADLRADFIRTWAKEADDEHAVELMAMLDGLDSRARAWITDERVPVRAIRCEWTAEMRYKGQSFTIPVPLRDSVAIRDARRRFHERYQAVYGYADVDAPVEIVDVRVQIVGETPKPRLAGAPPSGGPVRRGERRIFFDGAHIVATVYDRAKLVPGSELRGPAIIEQYDTTTFVPPGFNVRVDAYGNLVGEAV
jgi:N-methylhydantoinase A